MLHRRTNIRRVARLLLLVWIFALGSSMVHACNLTLHGAGHGHHGHASTSAVAHDVDIQSHDDDSSEGPGKATCVKFCDDVRAVSSTVEGGSDLAPPGLPPPGSSMQFHVEPLITELITSRARGTLDRPPLPIAIEYLRLAL